MHWAGIKPVRAHPAQCGDRVALPPGMAQWGEGQGEDISVPQEWPRALGTCGKGGWEVAGRRACRLLLCRMCAEPSFPFAHTGCSSWCRAEVQAGQGR